MMKCTWSLRTAAIGAMAVCASPAVTAQRPLVLRDVTVLSASGTEMKPGYTVLVRGDRIEQVGPNAEIKIPRRANVVDGRGRFVIPGLADLHVHIKRSSADIDRLFALFLAHGVTTVLNMDGGSNVLELRDEVKAGERLGPTIYTTGPIIRGFSEGSRSDGDKVAQRHIAAGYDLLKVYNGLSAETYRGIIDTAEAAGTPVIGHAVRSVGLEGALENGQHIAHMEEVVYGFFTWSGRQRGELPEDRDARLDALLDPSEIPGLARRVEQSRIFVTPNLIAYHNIEHQLVDLEAMLSRPRMALMPESMTRFWQPDRNGYTTRPNQELFLASIQRTFPFLQKLTASFQRAGVRLLAGTDVGIPMILAGTSLHDELEELVAAGLTPAESLATATRNAADFLGRDDAGRIAAGQIADLVLLRADPLENIAGSRTVEAVVLRGRLLERTDLDALLVPTQKP